jgi:hypothetical protein
MMCGSGVMPRSFGLLILRTRSGLPSIGDIRIAEAVPEVPAVPGARRLA